MENSNWEVEKRKWLANSTVLGEAQAHAADSLQVYLC